MASAGRPSVSPARAHLPRCTPADTPSSSTSPTAPTSRQWRSAMPAPKPERTDVCTLGSGAAGAAAAKVLTESGFRVVALERGPWRTKETFGGDELANVNRYNLWPDPLLNPRTYPQSPHQAPVSALSCPVPQMVGGGTVHWQGWLPRF